MITGIVTVVIMSRGLPHDLQANEAELQLSIATSINREVSHGFSPDDIDITYAVAEGGALLGADFPEATLLVRVIIPGIAKFSEFGHISVERDVREKLAELLPGLSGEIGVDAAVRRPPSSHQSFR